MDGLLVIDKPLGLTSRDAVNRIAGQFRGERLGHTGTLDPEATGVLVLCLGQATRLAEFVQDMAKVYRAAIFLGAESTTDDREGKLTLLPIPADLSLAQIQAALATFVGLTSQLPPAFSAAKVNGRRAYDLARQGKEVVLEPRTVRIDRIDVVRYEFPNLEVEVECGKGTYIRSLARDLGARLGGGAYLTALRRLRVGPYRAEDAAPFDATVARLAESVRPMAEALSNLTRCDISEAEKTRFMQGQFLERFDLPLETLAAVFHGDKLIGVGRMSKGGLAPWKVLSQT